MRPRGVVVVVVVAIVVAAVLKACAGGDTYHVCTDLTCVSQVGVVAKGELSDGGMPARIRLCVDRACRFEQMRIRRGNGYGYAVVPLDASSVRDVHVVMTLLDSAGDVLTNRSRDVALSQWSPNGEACPPRCFSAEFEFELSSGTLHRVR